MKARLNLTIDEHLLISVKAYAASKNTSVSELVEEFFKNLRRPVKRKTIIDLVEDLPAPKGEVSGDLRKSITSLNLANKAFKVIGHSAAPCLYS